MSTQTDKDNIRADIESWTEKMVNNPILDAIEKGKTSQEGFVEFAKQRYFAALHFEELLEVGVKKAQDENLPAIVEALAENLRDERGLSDAGKLLPIGSHEKWRQDYYHALGIKDSDLEYGTDIDSTGKYDATLRSIIENGSASTIAGAVLLQEYSIPEEFKMIQKGRDILFAPAFVAQEADDEETRSKKARARRYIDFHIVHDAGHHYPDLENAVLQDTKTQQQLDDLFNGVKIIAEARIAFYEGLQEVIK